MLQVERQVREAAAAERKALRQAEGSSNKLEKLFSRAVGSNQLLLKGSGSKLILDVIGSSKHLKKNPAPAVRVSGRLSRPPPADPSVLAHGSKPTTFRARPLSAEEEEPPSQPAGMPFVGWLAGVVSQIKSRWALDEVANLSKAEPLVAKPPKEPTKRRGPQRDGALPAALQLEGGTGAATPWMGLYELQPGLT
eukprot:1514218-Prymnesium_polylepis.1